MNKRNTKLFFAAAFATAFLLFFRANANECDYCKSLIDKGFPQDYAENLCKLHFKFPKWEFVPVNITELSVNSEKGIYTWEKCINEELCPESRSLVKNIPETSEYIKEGTVNIYDSGWAPAKKEAVEYFMDPRNFLNQEGIFQFLKLDEFRIEEKECVDLILKNTAFESVKCENFSDFSEAIMDAAKKSNISPLHLAVRLYNEQGKSGNCLFTGTAGNVLLNWYSDNTQKDGQTLIKSPAKGFDSNYLISLNGCYNLFNLNAGGTGAFSIYLSGAEYAKQNGWSSPEKALFGGTEKIKEEYIMHSQNTVYFQKWNVHPESKNINGKSRNFSYQYMQNIAGALADSKKISELLLNCRINSYPFTFLIPVYKNMPENFSPNPGNYANFSALFSETEHIPYYFDSGFDENYEIIEVAVNEAIPNEKSATKTVPVISAVLIVSISSGFLIYTAKKKKRCRNL